MRVFSEREYGDLLSQYDGSSTLYNEFDALGSTGALLSDAAAETETNG